MSFFDMFLAAFLGCAYFHGLDRLFDLALSYLADRRRIKGE